MGDEIKTKYSLIFEKVFMIKEGISLMEWAMKRAFTRMLWACNPISAYDYYFLLFYDG